MKSNGIFAVYKPVGMTSHDVVARIRRLTGIKRVGHGGTLDPLATGVLVIAIGRENTKHLDQYVKGEKEYIATIKLGEVSETDDSEGPVRNYLPNLSSSQFSDVSSRKFDNQLSVNLSETDKQETEKPIADNRELKTENRIIPSYDDIVRATRKFIGKFPQMPPIYSAKKVGGKTAYKMARLGLAIKLEPKLVEIMDIQISSFRYPMLTIRVTCGSGVYIRSLARDIGETLGTGAYLAGLERTRVAKFTKDDCITLEQLPEFLKSSSSVQE